MITWRHVLSIALLAALCAGCTTPGYTLHRGRDEARVLKARADGGGGVTTPWFARMRLDLDVKRLLTFSRELDDISREITVLQRVATGRGDRGLTVEQHDQLAGILFRYLMIRETLWDMVAYYGGQAEFTGTLKRARGFVIGYLAALEVAYHDTKLVSSFMELPEAAAVLNEGHPDVGIPGGTLGVLQAGATNIENLEALEAAWKLFKEELDSPRSALAKLERTDPEFAPLIARIRRTRVYSEAQTDRLLARRSILFPNLENRLRQARITELAGGARTAFKGGLAGAGSLVGQGVAVLIRAPTARVMAFTGDQVRQVRAALQPGDIILTFSEGYLTNLVIPGKFKHGLTYVGSRAERAAAGLSGKAPRGVPTIRHHKFAKDLSVTRLPSGEPADIIEAIADGVVFNSLEHATMANLNRLLILRPRLTDEERVRQLEEVMLRLDKPYDFRFNFADEKYLCCTEVIYHALHNRGPVQLPLVPRLGLPTLSADDIVGHYLNDSQKPFDFVMLLVEDEEAGGQQAKLLVGAEGEAALRALMGVPGREEEKQAD